MVRLPLPQATPLPAGSTVRGDSDEQAHTSSRADGSTVGAYTPSCTPSLPSPMSNATRLPSPSPSPPPSTSARSLLWSLAQLPLPFSPVRTPPAPTSSGTGLPTPRSSPPSVQDTPRDGTQSPREQSPTPPGAAVAGLSLSDQAGEPVPYDVENEHMPPHRFFSDEIQGKLRKGARVAERTMRVIDRLAGAIGEDETLDRLREDARRLRTFQATDTKTIAVLGDSGEGESIPHRYREPKTMRRTNRLFLKKERVVL